MRPKQVENNWNPQLLKGLLERRVSWLNMGLSACRGGGFNEESLYFLSVLLRTYARCASAGEGAGRAGNGCRRSGGRRHVHGAVVAVRSGMYTVFQITSSNGSVHYDNEEYTESDVGVEIISDVGIIGTIGIKA